MHKAHQAPASIFSKEALLMEWEFTALSAQSGDSRLGKAGLMP